MCETRCAPGVPARTGRGGSRSGSGSPAASGEQLQHLDHCGARRPDRRGRPGGGLPASSPSQIRVCRHARLVPSGGHCRFVPGLIRYASNPRAPGHGGPEPVLIVAAASRDQSFPVAGGARGVAAAYGRELCTSYGVPEQLGLVVDEVAGAWHRRAKREERRTGRVLLRPPAEAGAPVAADRAPEPPTESRAFRLRRAALASPGQGDQLAGPAMIEAVAAPARDLPPTPTAESTWGRSSLPGAVGPAGFAPSLGSTRLQRLLVPSGAGPRRPRLLACGRQGRLPRKRARRASTIAWEGRRSPAVPGRRDGSAPAAGRSAASTRGASGEVGHRQDQAGCSLWAVLGESRRAGVGPWPGVRSGSASPGVSRRSQSALHAPVQEVSCLAAAT